MKRVLFLSVIALISALNAVAESYVYGYNAEGITLQDTLVAGTIKTATISGYSNSAHSGAHYGQLEMLPKFSMAFAGCKITKISFCPFITSKTTAKIVISTEVGAKPLYVQTVSGIQSHKWTEVKLTTPFEITANQHLYIGYCIDGAAGDYPLGYYYTSAPGMATTIDPILDYIGCNNNKGTFTTGLLDTQTYSVRRQTANLMLYATIEGSIPREQISVDQLSLSKGEYVHPTDVQTLTTTITNVGVEPINSFDLTVELDGEAKVSGTQNISIQPLWERSFNLNFPAMPEGLHTVTVTVGKANGKENTFAGAASMRKEYLVYSDSVRKTVLIEHFTTSNCKTCVAGQTTIKDYIAKSVVGDDYIQVDHHSGYTADSLTTEEDVAYQWFYGMEKGGTMWAPANMIDRRDFTAYGAKGYGGKATTGPVHGTSGAKTDSLINVAHRTPSFITLNAVPVVKDGNQLTVKVEGSCLYDLPSASGKRLNVFLVEDSVASYQINGSEIIDDYKHNNVFRTALTGTWGEAGVIDGKSINKTYIYTIPQGWNTENMRVVAFIADYDSLSNTKCNVLQSTQARVEIEKVNALPYVLDESKIEGAMSTNVKGYTPHGWMYMSKYGAWVYSYSTSLSSLVGKAYLYTTEKVHLPAGKVYLSTTGTSTGDRIAYEVYVAKDYQEGVAMKDYATLAGKSDFLRNVLNTNTVDTTTVELTIPEEGNYVVGIRPLADVKNTQMTIAALKITAGIKGDANGDGVVSVADLSLMASYVLGNPCTINIDNADYNGDGYISVADISAVAMEILSGE